jgi:hypothetical protein
MQCDYETFRGMPWDERVTVFDALPAKEKAELVRTHTTRWLEAHRTGLTPEQIAIVEEHIAFVGPELYARKKNAELLLAAKELELRSSSVLSREQLREALTLHW